MPTTMMKQISHRLPISIAAPRLTLQAHHHLSNSKSYSSKRPSGRFRIDRDSKRESDSDSSSNSTSSTTTTTTTHDESLSPSISISNNSSSSNEIDLSPSALDHIHHLFEKAGEEEQHGRPVPFTPPANLSDDLQSYLPHFPPRVMTDSHKGDGGGAEAEGEGEAQGEGEGQLGGVGGSRVAVEARMRSAAGRLDGVYYHETELAERFLSGDKVFFESAEEKSRVLALVDEMTEREMGGGVVAFQEVDKGLEGSWLDQVVRGVYYNDDDGNDGENGNEKEQDEGLLDVVRRMTMLNGSYSPAAAKEVVDKVRSLVVTSSVARVASSSSSSSSSSAESAVGGAVGGGYGGTTAAASASRISTRSGSQNKQQTRRR